MSQSENPERLAPGHEPTVEDMRQLMGASTPHFALQLRERIRRLIRGLAPDNPVRVMGEREIARLDTIAYVGEVRGVRTDENLPPMRSLGNRPGGHETDH